MPELRRDPVTGRWVIISTERRSARTISTSSARRPIGREHCPFCPGHEAMTPPEVLAYRPNGGAPNTPGLGHARRAEQISRAARSRAALDREGDGMFDRMNGIGAHEVIIETPDHDQDAGDDERRRRSSACCGRTASGCSI